MRKVHWLEKRLASFENRYSKFIGISVRELWKKVDRFRHERITAFEKKYQHKWPAALFMESLKIIELAEYCSPVESIFEKTLKRSKGDTPKKELEFDACLAQAMCIAELLDLAAWRPCKDIVAFDAALYNELKTTAIGEKLPSKIIEFLPGWSLYFEAPGISTQGREFDGFFASLDISEEIDVPTLCLSFQKASNFERNDRSHPACINAMMSRFAIWVPISNRPLIDNIAMMESKLNVANEKNKEDITQHFGKERFDNIFSSKKMQFRLDNGLLHALNLVIYVCAFGLHDQKDYRIGQEFREPKRGEKKFTWRIFEAPEAKVWSVGAQFGQIAAKWRKLSGATRGSVRPHMRRSHWHGFWTGPMSDPEKRRLVVKLLPPIVVRGTRQLDEDVESDIAFAGRPEAITA